VGSINGIRVWFMGTPDGVKTAKHAYLRPPVNRLVAGSNPARGANAKFDP
jgi:hypothetical protein